MELTAAEVPPAVEAAVTNLGCTYLGIPLRSPIVAPASPMTNSLERLRALEHAGAGAVVLPSLFE